MDMPSHNENSVSRSFEPGTQGNDIPRIHVLAVDDDPAAVKLLSLMLRETPYSCTTAGSYSEALTAMEKVAFQAVISDLRMPGMSGLELLAETRRLFPHVAFLVSTGVEDLKVAIQAMRCGADDYLVKPLSEALVVDSLERALHKRHLEQEVENYRRRLEELVTERTGQLNRALGDVQRSYEETLRALGAAIDLRDSETAGHSWRVCQYSLELAAAMKLPDDARLNLARAAHLHDIGKLGVPDSILLKGGALTDAEWGIMREHAKLGFELLKNIPFLEKAAEIVLSHHERFDGGGYPRRLRGEEIPLGARIFSVADALDAITSDRPYRPASSFSVARAAISLQTGRQFDPQVVHAFLNVPEERWSEIGNKHRQHRSTKSALEDAVPSSQ